MSTDGTPRLITIPISHYCERARWALDYALVPYREEPHLQMFHLRAVRRAGARRTVPVLVAPGGEVLKDSRDIVAYADARAAEGRRLYPRDAAARAEVERLERRFEGDFGVESRRLAYYRFLPHPRLLLRYNNHGAPAYQRAAMRVAFPFARSYIERYLAINAETARAAERLVAAVLDEVAARLADGRKHLAGDAFTAADLTFAALAAPLVAPPQYGAPLPQPEDLAAAPALADGIRAFRAHPAGRYALRVYETHRPLSPLRAR